MKKQELTLDIVCGLMDKRYSLVYVDYLDSLDEHLDLIQKCIEEKSMDEVFQIILLSTK